MTYRVVISNRGIEPVTIGQVRAHTRIDDNLSDALLLDYIASARGWCETMTGLLLTDCTAAFHFNCLNGDINIPRSPIRTITSITYTDANGAAQTVPSTDYYLRERLGRTMLHVKKDAAWPDTDGDADVVVTTVAGYATPTEIPPDIITVIYRMVAHQYDLRGGQANPDIFVPQLLMHKRAQT